MVPTAQLHADQLVRFSRLSDEFERTKQECVTGEDAVAGLEFETFAKRISLPDDVEFNSFRPPMIAKRTTWGRYAIQRHFLGW